MCFKMKKFIVTSKQAMVCLFSLKDGFNMKLQKRLNIEVRTPKPLTNTMVQVPGFQIY